MTYLLLVALLSPNLLQDDASSKARSLIEKLRSEKIGERTDAARKLRDLGKEALPALEKARNHSDPEVRSQVRRLLQVIPLLERLPKSLVREAPGIADRLAAGDDHAWTEAFLAVTGEKDGKLRYPRLRAGDLDPLASRALRGVKTENEAREVIDRVQIWALESVTPALVSLITDQELNADSQAIGAIESLGDRSVVPQIARLLGHKQQSYRFRAADLLGELDSVKAVPHLLRALRDKDRGVREQAVESLGILGAREAVSELLKLLEDFSVNRRGKVCEALGRMNDPSAIPGLLETARKGTPRAKRYAVDALIRLGARQAVPTLIELLESGDLHVRSSIARALARFGGEDSRKALENLLKDKEAHVAMWAAYGLGDLGDPKSLPALRELLTSEERYLKSAVLRAWATLKGKAAVPTLLSRLDDPDRNMRAEAVRLLGKFGGPEEIPSVRKLLDDPSDYVRRVAISALRTLGDPKVGAAMEKELKVGKGFSGTSAIWSLARYQGESAIPLIKPLLLDPGPSVRMAAASALATLGNREGVRVLVKECRDVRWPIRSKMGSLFIAKSPRTLNALRAPGVWKRLGERTAPEGFIGTRKQHVEHLAKAADLGVEWSPGVAWEDSAWLAGIPPKRPGTARSVRDQLARLLQGRYTVNKPGRFEYILEPGRIRVVTYIEAIRFWEKWATEKRARRREY